MLDANKQQEVPWRSIAWNIVHNYLYRLQCLSLPTLVVMSMSLHTNGLEFIKSIKAGRESSGHMDHIFPLNKACYSMLVSLHQFFTKVCLSKHRAHLSTLHTTDSYYQASLWKAADFKIERKWVYECALRIIRALCIKWNLSGQHLIKTLQTVISHYHHNPVLIEFYICKYILFWLIQEEGNVSLDADKGKLQPFLFHVSMQKTSKPNWEGAKERNRKTNHFWMEMMAWKSIPNFQSTN